MAPVVGRVVVAGLLGVVCACLTSTASGFFTGFALPSAGLIAHRTGVARGGCGGLFMAKHRQNKGTKKHVKNRPRKSRPSDINRKPVEYSIEIQNNWAGAPPIYEVLEEAKEGIDLKASVIEAKAAAEWDAEFERMCAERQAAGGIAPETWETNELDMLSQMAKDLGLKGEEDPEPWHNDHVTQFFMSAKDAPRLKLPQETE